jgi:hypothetical protein
MQLLRDLRCRQGTCSRAEAHAEAWLRGVALTTQRMQDEIDRLKPGTQSKREPARPRIDFTEVEGQRVELPDISFGTTEVLRCNAEGEVFLDRRDVWAAAGWDEDPLLFRRP